MINKFKKFFKTKGIGVGLTFLSVITVGIFNYFGVFDTLELKMYDYRFHRVRGPLTGWTASDSTWINIGTDVVLVEVDDEAYRLIPEGWPYPRGTIWSKVIENLSNAGAKVIAFDIQFDYPEKKSEILSNFSSSIESEEILQFIPQHGDEILGETCKRILEENGTKVVMAAKIVTEVTRIPPRYISEPVEAIRSNSDYGMINDMLDQDNFSRRYSLYWELDDDSTAYLSLALKTVKAFLDIADGVVPEYLSDKDQSFYWKYDTLAIYPYGNTNSFLINYYGPPSGYKIPSASGNIPEWGTFPRFSLAHVLDTEEIELRDPMEDINWMSLFLPGETPSWIQAIEDPQEKSDMLAMFGLGSDNFDITVSPFYNKIVVIGVSTEVIPDFKSTPFYNYKGIPQLTPGMETHASAIQTLLHNNYIHAFGDRITKIYEDPKSLQIFFSHLWLIAALSILTFFLMTYVRPVVGGFLTLIEGLIYFVIACGYFSENIFWFFNPASLPGIGKSIMLPIIAPLVGISITYSSNIIYQFINEQKDKKFLKNTFGNYISPDLIDQMYEEKQEPKLGGDIGYHTVWFSDIQSFSAFSEVLKPEKMVSLMNEYLTEMTNVLLNRNGTLDKYIGDAIVAFWGAPVSVENHEYLACKTALEMEAKLGELRNKWKSEEGWPKIVHNMQHRVGLSSGELVTGNMGSTMRMNYTMMGDMVNLGARLESSAKQYGVYIQVEETLYEAVKSQFEWRFLDYVRVKGRTTPVKTYELLAEKNTLDENAKECIDKFHSGQKHYFDQQWEKAIKNFKDSEKLEDMFPGRNTNPSSVYIDRCEALRENPPSSNWDGVWTLTAK